MKAAHARHEDVHLITHGVNSLLTLLVFTRERADLKNFFSHYCKCSWNSPNQAQTRLRVVLAAPSLCLDPFKHCGNTSRFFTRVRNAIAHGRVDFDSNDRNPDKVMITLSDRPHGDKDNPPPIDWKIRLKAAELLLIAENLAEAIKASGIP
ncbi:MAG: hypothetical protein JST16_00725 [Bdellovibrionales bacterium]|nr:hypothetical protein [Bdellovibrionales bacterium]